MPFCIFAVVYHSVMNETAARIDRGVIDRIIASESPVYFDDNETPIGVFFDKTHRRYVHYEEIPKDIIKAILAAEDKDFFSHRGFDLTAVFRALFANIKSGKVVQGGSTITQQTAKNIFKREKRSYRAKLTELIQAFLLEKKYTKEEILEMYVNQFFVTGYGKGIGIAAQYFFGKEVKDLDLVEGAFIAGSLKAPNRYNPFIKKTEAEQIEAKRLAKMRKDYVLANMLKANFITTEQYHSAKGRDILFKEGKISYRLNVILDYIQEQLDSDYFRDILEEQGVENAATSGIRIYTSVNKEVQDATLMSLRTHLPVMDVMLQGCDNNLMDPSQLLVLGSNPKESKNALPFLSKITHIEPDENNPRIMVSWDGGDGIIDYDGIKPMGEAWLKWRTGEWAQFDKKHIPQFMQCLRTGDSIPVQVLPSVEGNGKTELTLSRLPRLEGAVIVVHEGMIKAMAGGYFNHFLNRAVDAKRQLGSIFKPIVYTAALQLKWNTLDILRNTRDIFVFENSPYPVPPAHEPESENVSMAWAGAKSENLATVWLLYHLTDHLNMSEFRQVVDIVGLNREERESYQEYKERIRDKYGVVVNDRALKQAAFESAKREVETDVIFEGYEEILDNLARLHFRIDKEKLSLDEPEFEPNLKLTFERLWGLNLRMKAHFRDISRKLNPRWDDLTPERIIDISRSLQHFYITESGDSGHRIIYSEGPSLPSLHMTQPLGVKRIMENSSLLSDREVWIDDLIPSGILDTLQEYTNTNYRRLLSHKRYDIDVLSKVRDFRILVNLSYVRYLSKALGISTELASGLSFPLGTDAISLLEAVLVYQTIMTGQTYPLKPKADTAMTPIITKIVDRDGKMLYEYKPMPHRVLSQRVSRLITEILGKVMEVGTGKKARDSVRVFDVPVPSFGKTGTADENTISSFVGFIPGRNKAAGQLDIQKGYVIASYVGYDDNQPMKSKHITIYGSDGALPLWIDAAGAIANSSNYKKGLHPADLIFDPLTGPLSDKGILRNVAVSPVTGLPVNSPGRKTGSPFLPRILSDVEDKGDGLELKRRFEPVRGE